MTKPPPPLLAELESLLYHSSADQRKHWAKRILNENLDVQSLFQILNSEKKIGIRFMWFLTEVGTMRPKLLLDALPELFKRCETLDPIFKTSFASYWLITGVPEEQETVAIDLMFHYALSAQTNVTIKARAILVLLNLSKKYPDLKNELILCIKDQKDKYTKDFEKRMGRVLKDLT